MIKGNESEVEHVNGHMNILAVMQFHLVNISREPTPKNSICDKILGRQSEVLHVTFSVFYLIEVLIRRGTFW